MTTEGDSKDGQRPALTALQRFLAVKKKLVVQPPPQQPRELAGTLSAAATARNACGAAGPAPHTARHTSAGPNAASGCGATFPVPAMACDSVPGPSAPPKPTGQGTTAARSAASLGEPPGGAHQTKDPAPVQMLSATNADAGGDASTCRLSDGRLASRRAASPAADAAAADTAAVAVTGDAAAIAGIVAAGSANAGQVAGGAGGSQAAGPALLTGVQISSAATEATQTGEQLAGQPGHTGAAAAASAAADFEAGGRLVQQPGALGGAAPDVNEQQAMASASRGGGSAAASCIRAFSGRLKIVAPMLKASTLFVTSVLAKKCGFSSAEDMVPRRGFSITAGQLRFDNCSVCRVRYNAVKSGSKHDGVEWIAGITCPRDGWLREANFTVNDIVRFQLKDGIYTLERVESPLAPGSTAPVADTGPLTAAAGSIALAEAIGVHERNKGSCGMTGGAHGSAAAAGPTSLAGCLEMEGSGAFLTQVGSCDPGGIAAGQERESSETAGAVSAADSGGLGNSRRGDGASAIPADDTTRAVSGVYVGNRQANTGMETRGLEVGPSHTGADGPYIQPDRSRAVGDAASPPRSASKLGMTRAGQVEAFMAAGAAGSGGLPTPPAAAAGTPAARKPKRPLSTQATSALTKPQGRDTASAKQTAKAAAGISGEATAAGPSAKRPRLSPEQEGRALTPPKHVDATCTPRPLPGGSQPKVSTVTSRPEGTEEETGGGARNNTGSGRWGRFSTGCSKRLTVTDTKGSFSVPGSMTTGDGIFARLHAQGAFIKHEIRFVNAAGPRQCWKVKPRLPGACPRMYLASALQALGAEPDDMVVFGETTASSGRDDTDGIPTFTICIKRSNQPPPAAEQFGGQTTIVATPPANINQTRSTTQAPSPQPTLQQQQQQQPQTPPALTPPPLPLLPSGSLPNTVTCLIPDAKPPLQLDLRVATRQAVAGLTPERLRGNCFALPASTVLPGQQHPKLAVRANLYPAQDAEAELQLLGVVFPRDGKAAAVRAVARSWRERRRRDGAAAAPLLQIPGVDSNGRRLQGWPPRRWHEYFLPPEADSLGSGGALRAPLNVSDILGRCEAMLDRQRGPLQQHPGGAADAGSSHSDGDRSSGDWVLPAGPVHLSGLHPCVDEARGGLGVCNSEDLPPGAAVGVLGGIVLQGHRGSFGDEEEGGELQVLDSKGPSEAEEYAQEGYSILEEATRAELRARGPGGNMHIAWQYLAMSYQLPYPDELMEMVDNGGGGESSSGGGAAAVRPKATSQSSSYVLCTLGHGNVLSLLNDGRDMSLKAAKGDCGQAQANCAVIPLSVHGVVVPLVITLCHARAGAQLFIDYGSSWWQQLAGPWEMAQFEDLDINTILHGSGKQRQPVATALTNPAVGAAVTDAAAVRVWGGAARAVVAAEGEVSHAPGATAAASLAPESAGDRQDEALQASSSTLRREPGSVQERSSLPGEEERSLGRGRERECHRETSSKQPGRRSRSRKCSRHSSSSPDRARTPSRGSGKRQRSTSCSLDHHHARSQPRPGTQEPAAPRQERGRSRERDSSRSPVDREGWQEKHRERHRDSEGDCDRAGRERDRDGDWKRERRGGGDVERGAEPQRQATSQLAAGVASSGPAGTQGGCAPAARDLGEAGASACVGTGTAAALQQQQQQPLLRTSSKEHARTSGMPQAAAQGASQAPKATGPATAARPAAAGSTSTAPPPAATVQSQRRRVRSRSRSRERPKQDRPVAPFPNLSSHPTPSARGQSTYPWRPPAHSPAAKLPHQPPTVGGATSSQHRKSGTSPRMPAERLAATGVTSGASRGSGWDRLKPRSSAPLQGLRPPAPVLDGGSLAGPSSRGGPSAQTQEPEELPPWALLATLPVLDGHLDPNEVRRRMASLYMPLEDKLRRCFASWFGS